MDDLKQMDLYALFGVSSTAKFKEIKTAYRKKSLTCHPDKNPDNPQAVKLFHQLNEALKILTDEAERASYDKVLKAREANKARNDALNFHRKKLKTDLEERERKAFEKQSAEERSQLRLDLLKKQTVAEMKSEVERVCQEKADSANEKINSYRRIRIRWKADKNDATNGGYNKQNLTDIFSKYGDIEAVVISGKKKGSALLEFSSAISAKRAQTFEIGNKSNPLKVKVIGGDINEYYASANVSSSKLCDSKQPPLFSKNSPADTLLNNNMENHLTELHSYEIPTLAVEAIRPLLEDWKPLEEPLKPVSEFVKWRSTLNLENINQSANLYKPNAYDKLVWDLWVPSVGSAVYSWECREWKKMCNFLMSWIPYISPFILDHILRQLILVRIQDQVDEWDPLTDKILIHSWIQPWISFLGQSFETRVYPTIRQKLSKAFTESQVSDNSAKSIIHPWGKFFEADKIEDFLVNHILPTLEMVSKNLVINPRRQCLDTWNWVMEWQKIIPANTVAKLLDKFFFPEWLRILRVWLSKNPNFDEICEWISRWELLIPDRLKSEKLITDNMSSARVLITDAIGSKKMTSIPDRLSRQEEPETFELPRTLKGMAQLLCESRGIELSPILNRFVESNQVYKCGKRHVYFDKDFIFVRQENGSFIPMSWLELVEIV